MKVKNKIYLLAGFSLLAGNMWAQNICISTPNTSLVLNAPTGGELKYLYYGNKLNETDLQNINGVKNCDHTAYPTYGMNCPGETALAVRHGDGNMSTQMEVVSVSTDKENQATLTTVRLKDKVYPFYIDVRYKAYEDVDMIETWTEISHTEKKPVYLTQFASAYLPIRRGNVWLSHLSGSWANEGQLTQEPLQPGMTIIKNKDGARNSHTSHAEVMFSLDGAPQENKGRVIGAALCYSGNYKLRIDTDDSDYHQFYAGINEENSSYTLPKGTVFQTPAVALTYSNEGLSGASRNFHKWGRTYKLAHGNTVRDILLNSWEGVYFDINQKGMDQMMGDIASMGGELFVMDDGWFGDKYPRKNDSSSLGDWVVDKNKLPEGIEGLIRDAKKHGIKFGIWIEPEMANTTSELYEKHPEWILKAPQRDPVLGRGGTQVVLDLANPEVQDFCIESFDRILKQNPGITFVKWDCNSPFHNPYSHYLGKNQEHLWIKYTEGLYRVFEESVRRNPDLQMMLCSAGGARNDYGSLRYFHEFWTSDNTTPMSRVFIQWGASHIFPAKIQGAHVTHMGNQPFKFAFDVAMSGCLGMDANPVTMSKKDQETTRRAVKVYKEKIRPVVQLGDLYRLVSPYETSRSVVSFVEEDKKEHAVVFCYQVKDDSEGVSVKLEGLDPNIQYLIEEVNIDSAEKAACQQNGQTLSGKELMEKGLSFICKKRFDSASVYLKKVK